MQTSYPRQRVGVRWREQLRKAAAEMEALGYREVAIRMARRYLAVAHEQYLNSIPLPGMAISLQLSYLLWSLLDARRPRRILDLGSGFSSLVFRLHIQAVDPAATVWTVDHEEEWLDNTRTLLQLHHLTVDNMTTWDVFGERDFDLILHDLDHMEMRAKALETVLSLARSGAAILLDDLHSEDYREYASATIKRLGLRCRDMSDETLDDAGRYSWLVEKP